MPDWKRLVEERLATLNLPPGEIEDVIAELAAHLEDSADTDTSASDDENGTLAEVPWPRLRRAIERTKRKEEEMHRLTKALLLSIAVLFPAGLILLLQGRAAVLQLLIWIVCTAMLLSAAASEANRLNQRTRSLWMPALTTFFGASVSLMACEFLHLQPRVVEIARIGMWLYWPWLASLPIFGAAGAFLSQRAQGAASTRLTACLSPVLIMLTVMLLIVPLGLAIDGKDFFRVLPFGVGLINWVAIPGIALLLGGAPFLRGRIRQSA